SILPTTFNITVSILYAILLLVRMLGFAPHSYGTITDLSGNPLSYAVIHIKTAKGGTEIGRSVADEFGRYFCLLADNKYVFTIDRKNQDGTYTEVLTTAAITAKGGIVKKNFVV
ncbi:MAG TPA: hypothetical protein VK675_03185, partial [Candidatus Paceibacterota bacterium]|nr:hypothetical protein [Candidatus Paceibacterota bacterium]